MNFLGRQPHLQPPPQQQLLPLPQQRYGFQTQILNIFFIFDEFQLFIIFFDYYFLKIKVIFISYTKNLFDFISVVQS